MLLWSHLTHQHTHKHTSTVAATRADGGVRARRTVGGGEGGCRVVPRNGGAAARPHAVAAPKHGGCERWLETLMVSGARRNTGCCCAEVDGRTRGGHGAGCAVLC